MFLTAMENFRKQKNSSSIKLVIDPIKAKHEKAKRKYYLNVIQIPKLRLIGFAFACLIVMLHNTYILGNFSLKEFVSVITIVFCYIILSWICLYFFFESMTKIDLGILFLTTDIFICVLAIYYSGGERSWIYFLLLGRVADQATTTVKRALVFSHLAVLSYVLMIVFFVFH